MMFSFKLEGTFLSRPMLTMNGQEVPYKTLNVHYYPEETYPDGVLPEDVYLAFSVDSEIGPLKAHTMYRICASVDGKLTLAESPEESRSAKMKVECKVCGKMDCECVEDAPPAKSFKEIIIQNVGK